MTKFNLYQVWTDRKGNKKSFLLDAVYSAEMADKEKARYESLTSDAIEIEEVQL